ncbi:hypothetical protein Tco_0378347 [Tanacetum coccineum]
MDDPNITIEEYIRLEEEKAQKRGKVFNWETAKYGKIWYDEVIHDLKSVETEFPAIAVNEKVSSETLSCEPTVSSLNDEIDFRISFDDSDDEDYTVIFEKNLFSYKIISTNDLKTDSENDNEKVMHSLPSHVPVTNMALPPREQRHLFLRYQGLKYTDADIEDFETRLTRIYKREVHRVQVFDFRGLPDLMAKGLSGRILMEHMDAQGVSLFTSRAILGTTPSYTAIRDPILRLCHRLIACSTAGRSQTPNKVTVTDLFYLRGIDFVARLAEHFGLLTTEILGGLTVIAPELPVIDMAELVRLQIYGQLDDTWAWVSMRPERQPDATAGALEVAEDAPAVDEGGQAVPAPDLVKEISTNIGEEFTKSGDLKEVRPIRRMGGDQANKKERGTSSASSTIGFDVESLAKLMVNDSYNVQKGLNMTELLQMKKMELAKEVEIRHMNRRKKDEALYLSTTHEELKGVIRARWNLTF